MTVATMPAPTATITVVRAPAMTRLTGCRDPTRRCRAGAASSGVAHRPAMSTFCGSKGVQNSDTIAVTTTAMMTMMPKRPVDIPHIRPSQVPRLPGR